MNILFIHNNFPGQFGAWAQQLAEQRGHRVTAIGSHAAAELPGINLHRYRLPRGSSPTVHPAAVRFEADCIRAEAVAQLAATLKRSGFRPDVIVAHIGWGESLFLREVWPTSKLLAYCEFYYHSRGHDVNFDPEFETPALPNDIRVRAKNAGTTLALADADLGWSPTAWQRSTFPAHLQPRIEVIHDGIDTAEARRRGDATLQIPTQNLALRPGDEVVTYVNRHLEPMRGLHIFLRALPAILAARPSAHIVIIGAESTLTYGSRPPGKEETWKARFLAEVADRIDPSRVHWLGRVARPIYLSALAVSRVHVYLTYPFVLSWSLLEAMSSECLVVASNTAPVHEVIEAGSNGLLVDFFDHQQLAKRVIEGLQQPRERFAALTSAARQTIVERFDRTTVSMPRLVELIERLAE